MIVAVAKQADLDEKKCFPTEATNNVEHNV